jgi:hypothetical protein
LRFTYYRFADNPNHPRDTKTRIFVPQTYTPKEDRMSTLALRSNGFKTYNIVNNLPMDYSSFALKNTGSNKSGGNK